MIPFDVILPSKSVPFFQQGSKKDLALPRELKTFAATDQNSGYSLSITSPISMEKNRAGQLGINTQVKNRKSSGLLKYVCHMLAITDLSYEIPVNKTPIKDETLVAVGNTPT
jgi:hypothetical protein